jgi:hypothetical protein
MSCQHEPEPVNYVIAIAACLLALGITVYAGTARGQGFDELDVRAPHPGHAEVHEFTKDWKRPSDGMSCCHDNDCRYSVAEWNEIEGRWWVWIGPPGENKKNRDYWRAVPEKALLPDSMGPQNGRVIVCERWGQVYCVRMTTSKF